VTTSQLSRRAWLCLTGGGLVSALAGCGDNWLGLDIPLDASYDDVLDQLHTTAPEFSIGLSNHGPMVMETLVALGREDRVAAWARRYVHELEPMTPGAAIVSSDRPGAIGDHARYADWIATYSEDATRLAPRELLAREWPVLCPAWASTHGLLRVAHAMRALDRSDTPSRRRELAQGLGYWAGRYDRLPGEPGARAVADNDVVSALAAVPLVPTARRSDARLIVDRLSPLANEPAFIDAIEAVDLDAVPIEQAVHDLVAAAARLYVADGRNEISLLHAVTGTAALSLLLPYLDPPAQRLGLGYAFQTVAGIHATHSARTGVPTTVPAPGIRASALADRARECTDEHQLKLGEACMREYAIEPREELLAAAALVLG